MAIELDWGKLRAVLDEMVKAAVEECPEEDMKTPAELSVVLNAVIELIHSRKEKFKAVTEMLPGWVHGLMARVLTFTADVIVLVAQETVARVGVTSINEARRIYLSIFLASLLQLAGELDVSDRTTMLNYARILQGLLRQVREPEGNYVT